VRSILLPLTLPYGLGVSVRNRLYDAGWLTRTSLPRPVISIGNLTAGGTGKTPFVIWLAERLLARGLRTAVLSRGYRRRGPSVPLLVSVGEGRMVEPDEAGDEPALIADRCPRAIVAVGADRVELGRWVLAQRPVDVFILDDGFQHRALNRDLDLVLIDVSDRAGLSALLPAGRLREPWDALRRADGIIVTRVDLDADVEAVMSVRRRLPAGAPAPAATRFTPQGLIGPDGAMEPIDRLRKERVVAFSGIGNAASFERLLAGCGAQVAEHVRYPDHHRYSADDVDAIRRRAGGGHLVTTEKDLVKLRRWLRATDTIRAIRLGIEFVDGEAQLDRLVEECLTRQRS
jgi:tetraacyldisaccharide 4'-kinase